MSAKTEEPTGSAEEIRFEDLDLVYVISFDLGAPVKAKDLGEWFSSEYKLVEGIWIPPSDKYEPALEFLLRKARELGIKDVEKIKVEELKKNKELGEEIDRALVMFRKIISEDHEACLPEYLELGRYARLKLIDLDVRIEDPEFRINKLKYELYLVLHDAGIGILTAWIHLNGDLSTDDVIEIEEKLHETKCTIKDPSGDIKGMTLREFIIQDIITPLQVAATFGSKYGGFDAAINALKKGNITPDELKKTLRFPYSTIYRVVCIRKHRCQDGCITAEDAVERHSREIYGILMRYEGWKSSRMDFVKEELGSNLSYDVYYAILVTTGAALFMGSIKLYEELKSEEDHELEYREIELSLVVPVEFLQLLNMILDIYISVYRNKFKELRERRRRGETVRPSEVMEIREELMHGLEEYNDVLFFATEPHKMIMEHGKERLMLSNKVNVLKSVLQELSDMARTFYEEEILKKQEDLSRRQEMLAILFGIFGVLFGGFQALEFLEPVIGLPNAIATIFATFPLLYPVYWFLSRLLYGKRR
jgi:hypothetical protein